MKARSVKILPVTELLIAPKHECKSLISSATFAELPTNSQSFLKVKEEKETEVCTQTSKQECLANRCNFYDRDSLLQWHKRQETSDITKPRLVFNTVATPCSYLNTNRQYLLCTKAPAAQKDRLPGAKFLLDFLASPCLRPAARKISQEKCGQSQQKQAADLAESSFTGLGKCGQTKSRFKLYFLVTLLQTDFKCI